MSDPPPEHANMPKPGGVVAEKYRVESVLGEGGMGIVYAATHLLTDRRVALKWMRPQLSSNEGAVQRFLREARVAGGIEHPNVIAIHDVGFEQGSAFIVMEQLQGEALSALLKRERPLPVADVLDIALRAMRGVQAAHARRIAHRDLKPDNIFLCRSATGALETVKVLDFGISKLVTDDQQWNPGLTQSGALLGTPYYMSPEQLRGLRDLDLRIDVYAFGVILYEALTGQLPFRGNNYGALALEIGAGTPRPPRELRPDLSPALEQLVLTAMARDRADRYPDMASLIAAIEGLGPAAGTYVGTPLVVVGDVVDGPRPVLHPRALLAALVFAVAIAALWGASRWSGREAENAALPAARPAAAAVAPAAAPASTAAAAVAAVPTAGPEPAPNAQQQPPPAAPTTSPQTDATANVVEQPQPTEPVKPKARPRRTRPEEKPAAVAGSRVADPAPAQRPATRTNAKVVAEDF
jgi:eukaryotic-like serine/threonine-protein kinase